MKKMTEFIEAKLNPMFGKFAALPFISALNKAFMTLLPLIMLGAFATLLSGLTIDAYQTFIKDTGIHNALIIINDLTLNLYGLWVAGSLGYFYSKQLKMDNYAVIMVFISTFAFLLTTPYVLIENAKYLNFEFLGSKGMFTAMMIAAISVRVYQFCINKKIYLKMPKGVPPFIQDSFAGLIPAVVIGVLCITLQNIALMMGYASINAFIYSTFATPLMGLTGNMFSIFILLTIPSLFWFFGIHGGAATQAIIPPLLLPLAIENASAFAAGLEVPHLFGMGIMNLTGCATIIWPILCLMSKQNRFKSFGKLAFVPAIFGVTEPCNFGIPLVMNPYLFIPQIILPIVNLGLMVIMMTIGILPYAHSMYVWGIPLFVSGFIQSGFMGIVFQLLICVVDFLIAIPFFKAYEKSVENEIYEED